MLFCLAGRGGGPAGPPLGLPNKKRGPEAKPPAPRFSGRFASRRRPPFRRIFHQRQKGNAKARPHDLRGLAHETMVGRDAAPAPPLGQSPGPRPMGPGGINRSAAGCYPRLPTAAVARISPSAQDRAWAAQTAPPRATAASGQQPLLRGYRRPRRTGQHISRPTARRSPYPPGDR